MKKSILALALLAVVIGLCLFWVTAQDYSNMQTEGHFYEDDTSVASLFTGGRNDSESASPSLEKWVWNEDKEGGADWDRYAAYGIGETVSFQVIASIPENYAQYSVYSFTITDELSEGFTFVQDSVKICINEAEGTDITEYFAISEENGVLTIHCEDIRDVLCLAPKNRVVLRYCALLDRDAVLGGSGNLGYIYMDYSKDPEWNGRSKAPMSRVFSNQTGVFSFRLDIQKVDEGTQLPVPGAEFVLKNEAGEYLALNQDGTAAGWFANQKPASILTIDEQGWASVIGLCPGTYYLKEIKAPKGYHPLEEPIKVVISAEYKENDQELQEVAQLTVQIDDGEVIPGSSPTKDRVEIKVENLYGTILPPTGGIGTTAYYIIGIVILFTVALFCATKRSVKNQ